jgi:hypothetical protein
MPQPKAKDEWKLDYTIHRVLELLAEENATVDIDTNPIYKGGTATRKKCDFSLTRPWAPSQAWGTAAGTSSFFFNHCAGWP